MPQLTLADVEHIADLARLELSTEEKERFRQQLSDILAYAARLQQLDTSGIPPTSSVLPLHSSLRLDQPAAGLSHDQVLQQAYHSENDQFRVPPVPGKEATDA